MASFYGWSSTALRLEPLQGFKEAVYFLTLSSLHVRLLQYQLHCPCFISFPLVHTSMFMFHVFSFSHFTYHSPSHEHIQKWKVAL